ncbi:hypothetical protein C8J57DRAFT_1566680 [Mycena rebaudengoi]|nr:hypothetical protein C8J57DRAFT_1566680 [Mycena rebaudengoi]
MGERRNERHPHRVAKQRTEIQKRRVRAHDARDSVLPEHATHAPALRPPPIACARRVRALSARRPRRNNEVPLPPLVASRDRIREQRGRALTKDLMEAQGVVGGRTAAAVRRDASSEGRRRRGRLLARRRSGTTRMGESVENLKNNRKNDSGRAREEKRNEEGLHKSAEKDNDEKEGWRQKSKQKQASSQRRGRMNPFTLQKREERKAAMSTSPKRSTHGTNDWDARCTTRKRNKCRRGVTKGERNQGPAETGRKETEESQGIEENAKMKKSCPRATETSSCSRIGGGVGRGVGRGGAADRAEKRKSRVRYGETSEGKEVYP